VICRRGGVLRRARLRGVITTAAPPRVDHGLGVTVALVGFDQASRDVKQL
jgi:hypothetical protein